METLNPQWVIAIASIIGSLVIVFVAFQAYYASKSVKIAQETLVKTVKALNNTAEKIDLAKIEMIEFHKLERNKKAIELLSEWVHYIADNGTGAKSFCEKLSFEQCQRILDEKSFKAAKIHKQVIENSIPNLGTVKVFSESEIHISSAQSTLIRQQAISYLNLLETILLAWHHNIADKKIIKDQFVTLVSPEKNKNIVSNLRKVAGGSTAFPAIDAFEKELLSDLTKEYPSQAPLGKVT